MSEQINQAASTITTQLWAMANKLRGTMDASEYKNYILPFMFYRYLSQNQDKYLEQNDLEDFYELNKTDKDYEENYEAYAEDISTGLGYVIEPEYSWESMIQKIVDHKIKPSDYQDLFDAFNQNAKRNQNSELDFANVFSDVNLGDTRLGTDTNARTNALNEILLMINDFNFVDEKGHDILGDVYEYLIGQFAANAGKKGGEFYTPHEVSRILAQIVTLGRQAADGHQFSVYDPTMGSGSLLLTVQKELPNSDDMATVDFYGQELNTTTYNLARMNLMMHGVNYQNMTLRRADTLDIDWPFKEKSEGVYEPMTFDAVVANPPYSQHWDTKSIDREKDVRFKGYGIAPASKADYAFVLHGLYHLNPEGTMAIVLPHGVLFRGASEAKIRKQIIENNLLDAIIGLPANLFYGTSIPTCILVFKGQQARAERSDVLFIDASKAFEKGKNQNRLKDEHIESIIEAYKAREDIDKFAHVASLDEIKENDYNLNIPRYVDTFEEEAVVPLGTIAEEVQKLDAQIAQTNQHLYQMMLTLAGSDEETQADLEKFMKLFEN